MTVLKLHLDEPPLSRFGFPCFFVMIRPLILRTIHSSAMLTLGLVLCQCASKPDKEAVVDDGTYWKEEHPKGAAKLVISLDEQRIGVVKGGELVGLSPISSGREGYDTRPGSFKVTEKDKDHRSSWYGAFVDESGFIVVEDVDVRKDKPPVGTKFVGAEMRYFMRFNGPIGLHQGYLPGYPASHGCIRLPAKMAERIFHAIPHGTQVDVQQNADLVALRPAGTPPVPEIPSEGSLQAKVASGADIAPAQEAGPAPGKPGTEAVADTQDVSSPFRFLGLGGGKARVKSTPAAGATVYLEPEQSQAAKAMPEVRQAPVAQAPVAQASKPAEEAPRPLAEHRTVKSDSSKERGSAQDVAGRKKVSEALSVPTRRPVQPRLRPITPNVPGLPPAPMTLAPSR